eukprot:12496536-Alexandrium_andersonii.AAC.1
MCSEPRLAWECGLVRPAAGASKRLDLASDVLRGSDRIRASNPLRQPLLPGDGWCVLPLRKHCCE